MNVFLEKNDEKACYIVTLFENLLKYPNNNLKERKRIAVLFNKEAGSN